ncbi:MAG: hypothetical protein LBI53_08145 [Candidatus Peribacteria bacterium]|jgi:hypothetical protein|nr:hypothetical protein [Candidatus Peribacteria bacterium]
MIIWLLLIIPTITIIFLVYKFKHKITWWEALIHFGVAILLIWIMKIIGEKSLTHATEYWGDLVERVEYYEEYSIWDHETCTRTVTDSNGNTHTERYDCSHLDYHPPQWKAITASGWKFSISKEKYAELMKRFNATPVFKDMHRERECGFGDYVVKDGNMYYGTWDKDPAKSYAVSRTKTYENKVQCSHSVFNFQKVTKEEAKENELFTYPKVKNWRVQTVFGGEKLNNLNLIEDKFHFLNGDLGPRKQVRVWILIFENKPLSIAKLQESYWVGGNKNEFIVCIGINDSLGVQWCYPFSWTEVHEIKINTRNFVIGQKKLDLIALSEYLYSELNEKWIRKNFKDFDYLVVEPPLWGLITAFILQIIFNIGFGMWAVRNEYENR